MQPSPAPATLAPTFHSLLSPTYAGLRATAGTASAEPLGEVETVDYAGVEIVLTFGAPEAEYAAIRKACGVMDLAHRAVLELRGKDRNLFLDNFLTNQMYDRQGKKELPFPGQCRAFLLNGKGRIVADMVAVRLEDRTLLVMDRRVLAPVRLMLEKYVFTEKVTFASPDVAVIGAFGPKAQTVLAAAGVAAAPEAPAALADGTVVHPSTICSDIGYELLVPSGEALRVWRALTEPYLSQQNKRDARPIGWAAFNTARVEAGSPLFGIDFTEESLAAETGVFDSAVSVTKGCYLGQEIVARMYARQVVAKRVVGFRVEGGPHLPMEGNALTDPATSNEVGRVTSSTISPLLSGAAVGLAVVKKPFFEPGTRLAVPAEGAMRVAVIVDRPEGAKNPLGATGAAGDTAKHG